MGWVQQNVVDPVSDAVSSVGDFVLDTIVAPVINITTNIANAISSDPIKFIAQVAAVATGNTWALPLIEGAAVASKGGSVEKVLEAAALSYISGQVSTLAGNYAGAATIDATGSITAGSIVQGGVRGATSALVYGKDPMQAFLTGGISAAVPAALGKIDQATGGYLAELQKTSPAVAGAITGALTASITGDDVTAATINGAIRAGEYATKALEQFESSTGKTLEDGQKSVLAEVMVGSATALLTGGNVSKAAQAAMLKAGSKALGDMATDKFKSVYTAAKDAYNAADAKAAFLDNNYQGQVNLVNSYNDIKKQYDDGVATQTKLYQDYATALATFNASPSQANADVVNARIEAYNTYSNTLKIMAEGWQMSLDTTAASLANLKKEQAVAEGDYEKLIQSFTTASDNLAVEINDVQDIANKYMVTALDPNFDPEAYIRINNLPPNVDPYDNFLNIGRFAQFLTNDKDVAVQAEIYAYKTATGRDIPADVLANLGAREDRDTAVKNFVDTALVDRNRVTDNYNKALAAVASAYTAEGLTQAQIDKKIASGEAGAFAAAIVQNQRTNIEYMEQQVRAAAEDYGTSSKEYKDAARAVLDAKASIGGYGITKDSSGNYTSATSGAIDPNTLIPTSRVAGIKDPVTGTYYLEIAGTSTSTPTYSRWGDVKIGNVTLADIAGGDVSSVLSIGQSAKPPSEGGKSVFGDGSGVSSGMFGGLQLIATDSGTGTKIWDGGNGFSLITYSDGHSVAVNNDTQEVVWLDNTQTKTLQEQIQQQNPTPPPVKEPILDPVKAVTDQIDQSITSAAEVMEMFAGTPYTPTAQEVQSFMQDTGPPPSLSTTTGDSSATGGSTTPTNIYGDTITGQPPVTGTTIPTTGTTTPTTGTTTPTTGTTSPTDTSGTQGGAILNTITALNAKVAEYEAAGQTRDIAITRAVTDVAASLGTTKTELLAKIGSSEATLRADFDAGLAGLRTNIAAVQQTILTKVAQYEAAGQTRDAALANAIAEVSKQQGVDKADLLAQLGTTAEALKADYTKQISGVRTDLANAQQAILQQAAKNEAAGQARDTALANAIASVSGQLGTTKTELLTRIGTTEANLNSALDAAKAELTGQIAGVKNTLGSATQAGTVDDVNHLLGILQGGGAYDAQYDYNGDGKLDSTDLAGLSAYVGGAGTGTTGTGPAEGSKWGTPTGVFKTIADQAAATRAAQAAEAAKTRAAQAAAAQKTQRMGNINTMMSLITQAPDAAGQQVTVKAADPTKIGYVYDFGSIFANPAQEKMFVTPYAEGGSVDEVNDELLRILKG